MSSTSASVYFLDLSVSASLIAVVGLNKQHHCSPNPSWHMPRSAHTRRTSIRAQATSGPREPICWHTRTRSRRRPSSTRFWRAPRVSLLAHARRRVVPPVPPRRGPRRRSRPRKARKPMLMLGWTSTTTLRRCWERTTARTAPRSARRARSSLSLKRHTSTGRFWSR